MVGKLCFFQLFKRKKQNNFPSDHNDFFFYKKMSYFFPHGLINNKISSDGRGKVLIFFSEGLGFSWKLFIN